VRLRLPEIRVINRQTGKEEVEAVFGEHALALLYEGGLLGLAVGRPLRFLLSSSSLFSKIYGWTRRRPFSRSAILPFVERFKIDPTEFVKPLDGFASFDDFFVRELKPECRPIAPGETVAVVPTDGRFWVCPDVDQAHSFLIKGHRYALSELLDNSSLASNYEGGGLVMARLCPTDYHRFHFPTAGTPGPARLLPGRLASVNPAAIRRWFHTYTRNKRMVTLIETKNFGTIAYVEIGATAVGAIHQTYLPEVPVKKAQEKGYFSFGGSALVLLFEKGRIRFSEDLVRHSQEFREVRCLLGQPLGTTC
jgi:phosphatidylserine decarboxylase